MAAAAEGGQEVRPEEVELEEFKENDDPDRAKAIASAAPKPGVAKAAGLGGAEAEKKSYMVKEREFYEALKFVQGYYTEICICLMHMGKFFFFLTGVYALFCMGWFGCGLGDCQNTLVCCVHYIKLL
jgi:hypothetical protein